MRRDNDTSVQPQLIAMGAACSDPGRGLKPMRTANHRPPDKIFKYATKTEAETEMRACYFSCGAHLCFSACQNDRGIVMNQKLIRYSMQIAMLKQLLALSLINESEFNQMKNKTMREYGIISDLTS